MKTFKTLTLTAALLAGGVSFALAQAQAPVGDPANNAAHSGGAGTHQSSQRTGTGSNDAKVIGNQNGYQHQ